MVNTPDDIHWVLPHQVSWIISDNSTKGRVTATARYRRWVIFAVYRSQVNDGPPPDGRTAWLDCREFLPPPEAEAYIDRGEDDDRPRLDDDQAENEAAEAIGPIRHFLRSERGWILRIQTVERRLIRRQTRLLTVILRDDAWLNEHDDESGDERSCGGGGRLVIVFRFVV
jgi:hypothetical protein